MTGANDGPFACRHFPIELAIGACFVCEIDDFFGRNGFIARHGFPGRRHRFHYIIGLYKIAGVFAVGLGREQRSAFACLKRVVITAGRNGHNGSIAIINLFKGQIDIFFPPGRIHQVIVPIAITGQG